MFPHRDSDKMFSACIGIAKLVQKLVTYYDQAFLDSKPLSHLQKKV